MATKGANGTPEIIGSHLLLTVGRRPNTDDLGLDEAGVRRDEHGYVAVDDQLRTSMPDIWALGDCNGRGGDEVIHCVLDLTRAKAPYTVLQRAMHIHPTVSELLPTILGAFQPL